MELRRNQGQCVACTEISRAGLRVITQYLNLVVLQVHSLLLTSFHIEMLGYIPFKMRITMRFWAWTN